MDILESIILVLFVIWGYIAYKDGISKDHFATLILLVILVLIYKFINRVIKEG
jgi:hypothetical protein